MIHSSSFLSSFIIIFQLHVVKQITCPVLETRILRWGFSGPHAICRRIPCLKRLATQYKLLEIWIICTVTHSFCFISLISLHRLILSFKISYFGVWSLSYNLGYIRSTFCRSKRIYAILV
nr:MAG TPA: hypothetical protein [Bacteriophage sp.]